MIAPENRLLFHTAVIFVPSAAMIVVFAEWAPAFSVIIGTFILVAVVDAVLGFEKSRNFTVSLPREARLFRDRKADVKVTVHNATGKKTKVRLGLAVPETIETPKVTLEATLPEGFEDSSLDWPVTGKSRGNFVVKAAFLGIPSPLGLWTIRKQCLSNCRIKVYPDLISERKNLAALFSKRGAGAHPVRQLGKGREFEQLRDYLPGDVYEDICWKATARRGKPVTRIYQVERTREIYVVLDSSRLSGRPCRASGAKSADAKSRTTILDRFVTAAMVMEMAARSQGDLFGLVNFSDSVESFIRAGAGKHHSIACASALYSVQPKPVAPDLEEVFTFIAARLRRRALLIFLTSLDDPVYSESFVRRVEIVRGKHLAVAAMLKPEASRPLFTGKDVSSVQDLYRELGAHFLAAGLKETEKSLRRKGVGFHLLDNERLCGQLVHHYLTIKRRQIL